MKQYVMDIIDSLQGSLTLKSLTLCKIGSTVMGLIERVLDNTTTIK